MEAINNVNLMAALADQLWEHLRERILAEVGRNQSSDPALPEWLTKQQAMELLGVGSTTLYNLCKDCKIARSYPTERRPKFSRRSIDEYLASRKV